MIHCITYPGGTEHEKMAYIIRNKVDVQPGIKERKSMKEQSTKAVAKKKFFKMVFKPCRNFCDTDIDTDVWFFWGFLTI